MRLRWNEGCCRMALRHACLRTSCSTALPIRSDGRCHHEKEDQCVSPEAAGDISMAHIPNP